MGRKLESSSGGEGELGDDNEIPQFEACGDHGLAESSQIVLVGVADLFDEPVNTQTLEQSGNLRAFFAG
jgi:hypothetical protein